MRKKGETQLYLIHSLINNHAAIKRRRWRPGTMSFRKKSAWKGLRRR